MNKTTSRMMTVLVALALLLSQFVVSGQAAPSSLPSVPVTFTILHTNDFHGNLEQNSGGSTSNPGMARTANVVKKIRDANTALGRSTLLVDAGDEMQGSLLSNVGDGTPTGKGLPTIDVYNTMGYNVATFIRTEAELGAIAVYKPFSPAQLVGMAALNIAFLAEPLDKVSAKKVMALRTAIDEFHLDGREVYWLCRKKQSESTFSNAVLEKTIARASTLRGMETVRKMAEKYGKP